MARPSYAGRYGEFLDPRAGEITGELFEFGRKRLKPENQAISPEIVEMKTHPNASTTGETQ